MEQLDPLAVRLDDVDRVETGVGDPVGLGRELSDPRGARGGAGAEVRDAEGAVVREDLLDVRGVGGGAHVHVPG
ncbi:hypothetical protein O2V63_03305 [Modestobacter sp. VKM Ac-2977]|nr:hypothetical protein [Modestobacter sp. VKM Ac-2977]